MWPSIVVLSGSCSSVRPSTSATSCSLWSRSTSLLPLPTIYSTCILYHCIHYIYYIHTLYCLCAGVQGFPGRAAVLWLPGCGGRTENVCQPQRAGGGIFIVLAPMQCTAYDCCLVTILILLPVVWQLSVSVATDLFHLFDGRRGDMIAATNELILAFSMVGQSGVWSLVA